uniref:Uncharacterized protein n=1 Tax=Rhodnius prolixus TaxID=13249 RepID=T1HKV0_RHOPR
MPKSPAERKAAQREAGVTKFELNLDTQELDMLRRNCAVRRPGSEDALQAAADEYLNGVAKKRAANISTVKSFEAFRRWVTIESGHYEVYELPDGSLHKEPRSISFAKMEEIEFHALYKATLDVLWTFILSKTFPTQQSAENAAAQLMEFAA